MKQIYFLFPVVFALVTGCSRQDNDFSEWRGPNRQGIFYETGLLKTWPENGPEMLWSFDGLGAGHGNVSIGHNRLFVNGMPDTLGVLYSFDLDGNLLWEKVYGTEWHVNFTGSRSTPVGAGDLVYLESGMGVVYCMDALSGDIVWEVDLLQEVALVNMDWNTFEIKGRFEVPLGTDQHWAHPVIKDKRMYIRHGDALMVYDISAG